MSAIVTYVVRRYAVEEDFSLAHLFLAAGAVLTLDQASKAIALRLLTYGKFLPIAARVPVGFRLLLNAGVGPKFLGQRAFLIGVWIVAVFGTVLASFCPGFEEPLVKTGLGAAVGGATGNLFDRTWRAGVVDFIDLHLWPVFNIADMAIVFGIAGALMRALMVVSGTN